MKIEDNRRNNKCIMFKDLEDGRVFEHVGLEMIMIKFDNSDFGYNRNAGSANTASGTELGRAVCEVRVPGTCDEIKLVGIVA